MGRDHLGQLSTDGEGRVERSSGILGDVGDDVAPQRSSPSLGCPEDLVSRDSNRAFADSRSASRMARGVRGRPSSSRSPTPLRARRPHPTRPRTRRRRRSPPPACRLDSQVGDVDRVHREAPRRSTPAIARAMPSAMRFVPTAKRAMQDGGNNDGPRLERQHVPVLVDHQPPIRVRRLNSESQEADRGDQRDRPCQAQAVLDHQRCRDVRQDLLEHDLSSW